MTGGNMLVGHGDDDKDHDDGDHDGDDGDEDDGDDEEEYDEEDDWVFSFVVLCKCQTP